MMQIGIQLMAATVTYPDYLKLRASDCIRLAVELADRPDADALIDLAGDYRRWAACHEQCGPAPEELESGLDDDFEAPARRWHFWTRH